MKAGTNTKSHGGIALQTKVLDPNVFEFYLPASSEQYKIIHISNFNIERHCGPFLLPVKQTPILRYTTITSSYRYTLHHRDCTR